MIFSASVGRSHFAGDDVIGQDLRQRRLVLGLEQAVHRARRQLRERLVGRREDRERTLALERVDEAGRLHRGDERRVVLRVDRVVDDVLRGIHRRAADHRGHLGRGESIAAERAMAVAAAMDASFLIGLFSNIGCVDTTGAEGPMAVGASRVRPGGYDPDSCYGRRPGRDAAVVKNLLPSGENRTGIVEIAASRTHSLAMLGRLSASPL